MSLRPATEYADEVERHRTAYRAAGRVIKAENITGVSDEAPAVFDWKQFVAQLPSTDLVIESKIFEKEVFFITGVERVVN